MKRVTLGGSDIEVSAICLGTMTFGNQTDEGDAQRQMDRALDAGITFFDSAEMYPVNPVRRETIGATEEIVGRWLAGAGRRERVEIATKMTGPSQMVRDGAPCDGATMRAAIDGSLRRLRTDRIDLYQLHWPVRGTWAFRQNWSHAPKADKTRILDHMADILAAASQARRAGKIGAFVLSNETAWGLARWCDVADRTGAPRPVAIQNEYSPLCRLYDTDLAETAVQEDVTLLGFSPLAAGLLTGKYSGGAVPGGSRASVDKAHGGQGRLGGRLTARAIAAADAFGALASGHGWDRVHMAVLWQATRPFKAIPIIGATSVTQLDHLLAGMDQALPEDLVRAIDRLHRDHPQPY